MFWIVVHIGEWNTSQVFVNQMVDFIYALSNGCRANLFIIAYEVPKKLDKACQ